MNKQFELYAWGFPKQTIDRIPPQFVVKEITGSNWPKLSPIVVHYCSREQFMLQAREHPLSNGSLPDAILYLSGTQSMQADEHSYFDAQIKEGQWIDLENLLACPHQFKMHQVAIGLKPTLLDKLKGPIEDVPYWNLPIPIEIRRHLAVCDVCQAAFNQGLKSRLQLHNASGQ